MSFLLHALLLLLLAFVIQLRTNGESLALLIQPAIVDTQLGDVTSLVDATRAGDPFTTNDSPDPPSLGLPSTDPELKLVGQPQIASLSQFAPAMASPLLPTNVKPGVSSFARSRTKGFGLEGMIRLPEFAESRVGPVFGPRRSDARQIAATRRRDGEVGEIGRRWTGLDRAAPACRRFVEPEFPGSVSGGAMPGLSIAN